MAVSPTGQTVFVTGFTDDTRLVYRTAAYDTATGAQRWARTYCGGCLTAFPTSIAVSPTGNTVYVTGYLGTPTSRWATVAYSATSGAQLWVKRYGLTSYSSRAESVALSPSGKTVFVTGFSNNSSSSGASAIATVAYNAASGAQRWVKRYGNTASSGASLAVSPSGKVVFVAGSVVVATTSGQAQTPVTIAYSAATGARLWVRRYTNQTQDAAVGLAVSPTGNRVFVIMQGKIGYPATPLFATIAYAAGTGAQLWTKPYTSPASSSNTATAVAVSPTGKKVFVTGSSGTNGQFSLTVGYNAATGAQLWAQRYGSGSGGGGASIAVSPTGSTVFVTGHTDITDGIATFAHDYATIAYDAGTGTQQWATLYGDSSSSHNYAYCVAVSPDAGTVFVTGTEGGAGWTTIAYHS
jgi:hypothetical protein